MQKRDVGYLVIGMLITAVASCGSPSDDDGPSTLEPEWAATSPAAVASQREETPPVGSPTEPPLPPPLPTADDWQSLGSDRAGLSLSIPPTWIDMTGQINVPTMGNRLGINLLLVADSEHTGRSLLAGKSFANGAYISGLIVSPSVSSAADPAAALIELLAAAAPSAVRLTPVVPVVSANGVTGYAVDVGDGPIGLTISEPNDLRTRVVLFTPPPVDGAAASSWIVLLLSASGSRWEQNVLLFDRMLQSARVFDVRPGMSAQEGNVVVRGALRGDRDVVGASLERGVNDLWTFTTGGNSYASIFLTPEDPQLDLTLSLLGPDRHNVARVENGYAGMTESTTDVWLAQPGEYIIEVSEFFHASGRYTLSLVLSGQPQYSGGGSIAFDQVLEGKLPANGQHFWVFPGAARQRVSIVVEPGEQPFDAILELYAPDGGQLIALDEGFSGDPEVISGFELPANGEYAILVRSFSPQGGSYTLSLDEGDRPIANFYDAGDLTYGVSRRETLQPREAHAWFFQGKAGDHILVHVTPLGANLDPDVWLLNEAVERIAAADASAAGESETIELTLSEDGQYIVLVRDFNGEPGDYEVALGAAPAATPENAGSLSYGDTIIGAVKPNTAVAWSFNAQTGDVIDVDVQAMDSGSDVVLGIQGPDGLTALEVDENSAGGDESIHAFVVPAAGQWRVVLREFFGGTANYRLSLARAR
jgi:hypothetical protein